MRSKDYGDKRIIAALRPVLRRIQLQHYLHWLLRGLAGALLLSAFFLLLSFFFPWVGVKRLCLYTLGASLLLAWGWSFWRRPGLWTAACMSDAKGLQERVSTALECSAEDSEMIRRQRRDALEQLQNFDFRTAFPFIFPAREGKIIAAGLLLVGLFCFLPNPQQAEVDRAIAVKKEIARQEKKIEAVKKEIQAKFDLISAKELEKTVSSLEKLQKDLHETGDMKKALKSLAQAEETLEQLRLENLRQGRLSAADLASLKPGQERREAATEDSKDRDNGWDEPKAPGSEGEESPGKEGKSDSSSEPGADSGSNSLQSGNASGSASNPKDSAAARQEGRAVALAELNRALRAVQDSRQALLAAGSASPSQWASAQGYGSNTTDSSGSSGNNAAGHSTGSDSSGAQGGANSAAPDSCSSGSGASGGT
ncbi:hypothetical protein [Syntrophomonas wolfei]|uniref:Uncharacterized protein n=1 Tax=Syntrophomonas wolfei subsp. wolfei (strain DSM 2245B / Goettingen) TaxID=335541 RepID=Q0AW85_SYNWW|nr:hypothetical protein [Syntrophomonas wolfei]ABI69019.1 hypothetical protein Swol_1721 [Syntrophomonas wolfei subsp. wolfei str. Goettingen G311]